MLNYEMILSRDSYLLAIELRLFWFVSLIYGLALILYIFHIITRANIFGKAAATAMFAGVVVQAVFIALRAFEAGRVPFLTLYESLSWFAFCASVTYLYESRRWKNIYFPGVFVSALSMGACLYALFASSPAIEPLSPALQSYWFEWHAVLAFFSYAVLAVSASIEAAYLILSPFVKKGGASGYGVNTGNIMDFHRSAFRLVLFGYPLLTFAIFSGAAWTNEALGRYWSWDPKETWSLITWTVFTVYLHSKTIPALRGWPASVFNIIGFISVIMTFPGINWMASLSGIQSLHTYIYAV